MQNQNTNTYAAVLGSLHLDYIVDIPYIPVKGETLKGQNLKVIPGGKGGNQAFYLALQGVKTYMLGKLGNDAMAVPQRESLEEAGVDCTRLETVDSVASGMSLAMVTDDKDYSAVIMTGANQCVDNEYIDSVKDIILSASVLVLQYEIPLPTIEYTVKLAKGSPCKVILNAAPAYNYPEILEYTDILIVNEVEAAMLSGIKVKDKNSATKATRILSGRTGTVITTLGGAGLIYVENNAEPVFMPARRVDVVDSHGAGDSFVGGLSAKIAQGESLQTAIEYAMAVAALSVQNKGPKTSSITPESVNQFLMNTNS